MTRIAYLILASLLGTSLVTACGETNDTTDDAGDDTSDAGTTTPDAGPGEPDTGTPDAGPVGCQEGCEFVEISLGLLHSCGRRANGEVLCWGRGQELQLGDGRLRHEQCAEVGREPEDCSGLPVNVRWEDDTSRPIIDDATQVTTRGFGASCALRGGDLWCWSLQTISDVSGGIPRQRQIAEHDIDALGEIAQASVSDGHLCVVQGTGRQVYCAGNNSYGQLGLGDFVTPVVDPAPVMLEESTPLTGVEEVIVSHGAFTCARTSDAVYCWGINDNRQFGDGIGSHSAEPCMGSSTTDVFDCSNTPVEVGPEAGRLGAVSSLALGSSHACAVVSGGQVVCWGDNRGGQCAQPEENEIVDVPTPVEGIEDAVQVAAGSSFSCALHADGSVSCWGSNLHGQLGDGVAEHAQTCQRGSDRVDCSRSPVSVSTIDDATSLAANASHACVIREDGSVWCWGRNGNKQLGTHDRENRREPVMVRETGPKT